MTCKVSNSKMLHSKRVIPLLMLDVGLIISSLTIAIHGTWLYSHRLMKNLQNLTWKVGLFRVSGSVVCDSLNDPFFFSICMSIFKNLYGSLFRIQKFICQLDTLPLKLEPHILHEARGFQRHCLDFTLIFYFSIVTFLLILLAQLFFLMSIISCLRFAYYRFRVSYKVFYWFCCFSHMLGAGFLVASLVIYFLKVIPYVDRVMIHEDISNPENSLLSRITPTTLGWAFLCLGVISLVEIFLIPAYFCCIPVQHTTRSKKDQHHPTLHPQLPYRPSDTDTDPLLIPNAVPKASFWAYMPNLFNPDIYVTEIPELNY